METTKINNRRKIAQANILQTLQESWPQSLPVRFIAQRSGYSEDAVRRNLKNMSQVILDLRYKRVSHYRPAYQYLPHVQAIKR